MLQIKTHRDNLVQSLRQGRLRSADLRQVADEHEAAEAAAAQVKAAEAKRIAAARAKVDRALDERAAAIAGDYTARQQEAIIEAARALARDQLEMECGVNPARAYASSGPPAVLLTEAHVERALARMTRTAPVPWVKGQPADLVRSAQTQAATEALSHDDVERRIEARKAELAGRAAGEAARTQSIAERKRAAGLPGWTDGAA